MLSFFIIGVSSVAIKGKEKDEVEVIGDEVDSVKLTMSLRKKVSCGARLLSVEEVKPKEEKKDEAAMLVQGYASYYNPSCPPLYPPSFSTI